MLLVAIKVTLDAGRGLNKNTYRAAKKFNAKRCNTNSAYILYVYHCPFKLGVSLIKDVFLRYQHPVILEMVQLSSFQFIKEKQNFDL